MRRFEYVVTEPEGLHALPATALCEKLNQYQCDIFAELNGQIVDAKSIMGLFSLGAQCHDVITFTCNGSDEDIVNLN